MAGVIDEPPEREDCHAQLKNKLVHEYIKSGEEMLLVLMLVNEFSGELKNGYDKMSNYAYQHLAVGEFQT